MTDDVQQVNGEQQEETTERPRISLEARLGAVLAAANASSDEIRVHIEEAEKAANDAEREAERLHAEARELGCSNSVEVEQQALAADLLVEKLDAVLPQLDAKLRTAAAAEYALRWRARRDRAVVAREAVAKRLASYREIAAQLAVIFEEVRYLDSHIIEPVNQSRPSGEAVITTCELYARRLDAFSRSMPSILDQVRLPNWEDSERMVWPPRQVPMSVMVAESMVPQRDERFTDNWASTYEERRAQQAAEHERVAQYYEQQQERAKEEREAAEERRAAAERQRSGIT